MKMSVCASCCNEFEKKNKGYKRHSLENIIPGTNTVAREAISFITGVDFESVPERQGYFLCPECWSTLSGVLKYKAYLSTFCENTKPTSYIALQTATEDTDGSVCKNQPCATNTPVGSENQNVITEHNSITRENNDEETLVLPGPSRFHDEKLPPALFQQNNRQQNKRQLDIAAGHIKHSEYTKGYRTLLNATKTSRKQFFKFICNSVRKEVRCLRTSTSFPLFYNATPSNLKNFSWDSIIYHLAQYAPVLYSALFGVLTDSTRRSLEKNCRINPKVRLGTALSCLLYTKYPRNASFIPSVYSIKFAKIRKLQAMKYLYRAGLCTQIRCASAALNRFGNDFETAAKTVFEMGKANDEEEDEDEIDDDDTDDEESGSDDEISKEEDEDEENDVNNSEEAGHDRKEEN
ncbi:hypothetical protein ACJMK2_038294 [Sinanodonta woodiana]|uniref:ZAD domain-containing protein n=1 Tax=Sinanodonta woodiana TaxID=1069815 RepID=A0ABD3W8J3_SINWO